jgi:hypothetical protein
MRMNRRALPLLAFVAATLILPATDRADDDDDDREHERSERREREGERERKHDDEASRGGGSNLKAATDPTYKEMCGACHLVYPPELLPARSWERILGRLDTHFGESPDAKAKDVAAIAAYLKANAADRSTSKKAVSIMRSIGSETPERITDIPYIKRKHDETSASVFARKSIGSRSNCIACHRDAEQGVFDEDGVSIPK